MKVSEIHEKCIESFQSFMIERGYSCQKPLPLIPEDCDDSVLFTGSTISAFKPEIKNNDIPNGGMFVVQPCIRTQDFKTRFNDDFLPFGQTYFEMIGSILPCGKYDKMCSDVISFLVNNLNVREERILIIPTKEDDSLISPFFNNLDLSKIRTTKDESKKYKWKYGIQGIHGDGISINIMNPGTNSYWDVANIVSIRDELNNEIAVEFGAGIEFLTAASLGVDNPLKMSKIADIENINGGIHQKFCAYYEAVLQLMGANIFIGDKKTGHIYKQYLKSISYLSNKINYTLGDLEDLAQKYIKEQNLKIKDDTIKEAMSFIRNHRTRINNFYILLNRIHICMNGRGKEKFTEPRKTIKDYLKNNGIRKEEIAEYVLLNYEDMIDLL
jgi:hypothetical protein